ncbi:MAG: efflux RND transporter periplasmic adaptor subunit [Clostridiales bacterium]|nr:efflux RND transporter periplasmic adaptor subunit [Clostridiales bacterium]
MKKGWKIGIALGVVTVLGVGGFFVLRSQGQAGSKTTYTTVQVTTGDLEKSVTGTGTVAMADSLEIKENFDITITAWKTSTGQSVNEGDLLASVDIKSLSNTITSLESQLSSLDSQLTSAADSYSTTKTVTSTVEGRVKQIFAETGDRVSDVEEENGALITISLDGKMKVEIDAGDLAVGDSVKVADGDDTYTGTVASVADGKAVITFSDAATAVDAEVSVTQDGETLGSGKAAIHQPVSITAQSGTVSKVYVSLNKKVYKGTSLLYLKNVSESAEYTALLEEREETYEALQAAKKILQNGGITAPQAGIVSEMNAAAGQSAAAGTALASLYTGSELEMVVQIDELDISSVEVGQEASIAMDALEDKAYTGEVTQISQIGSTNSGVTTHSVTLRLTADEELKIGMNGTATIVVEKVEDAVLVPLQALQTSKGEQYVWKKDDTTDEDAGNPGTKTVVTTGLSDETYAQVLSGLAEGDEIVIVRTATENTGESFPGGMIDMSGMMDMGGQMPDISQFSGMGGERPDGGGSVPGRQGGN